MAEWFYSSRKDIMTRFIKSVFVKVTSTEGMKVKGGRLTEGDVFRDRVGIGDEAYAWAVLENMLEFTTKCYWGHDSWFERWSRWGHYVYQAREDQNKTEIEEEAWKVHH